MDLFGAQGADRGAAANVVQIAFLAARQRSDAQGSAPLRCVLRRNEGRKAFVRGNDLIVDGGGNQLGQTLLIFRGDAGGKLLGRQQKRVRRDDTLALRRHFLNEKSHRHQVVLHSRTQHILGLQKNSRNLVQTRDVILVVLDRIQRH